MSLQKICNSEVITITQNACLRDVVKLMKDRNVGSIIILKDNNEKAQPVGILTDRDILLNAVLEGKDLNATKASEIMTKDLLTLNQDQGIQEAIKAMQDKCVRRAPVLDSDGKVAGIAAVDDLLILIADELKCVASIIQRQTPETMQ